MASRRSGSDGTGKMKSEKSGVLRQLSGKKYLLAAALFLGVLLLVLPRGGGEEAQEEESPAFSLAAEEKRIAQALSRIEGAGSVTVVLTLDTSSEREYARNTEGTQQAEGSGGSRAEEKSEVAEVSDSALTVKYAYPRYRGALVIIQGGGSAVKLEVTQAVAALTGLSTDKITVVKGVS